MKKKAMAITAGIIFMAANLYAAGDLVVNGKLGVGTTNLSSSINVDADNNSQGLRVTTRQDPSDPKNITAALFSVNRKGVVADPYEIVAFKNTVNVNSESTVTSPSSAFDNLMFFANPSGKTATFNQYADIALGRMYYGRGWSHAGTMNATNIYGLLLGDFFNDGGTGTISTQNFSAIRIKDMLGGIVNATTNTGLWIDDINGGSKNYGIVLDGDGSGADVVFGHNQESRIYSQSGRLYAQDQSGNQTVISPHDPETGEWVFYSKNTKTGRVLRVEMEKLVNAVEKLTGEKFMTETFFNSK